MYQTFHFPLQPSNSQVIQLENILSVGKEFWNYIVKLDRDSYTETKKGCSKKTLEHLVKNYKSLSENNNLIHTHLYQNIITRFDNSRSLAFKKFKSSHKPNKKLELPKLKEEKFISSLLFKEYGNGAKIIGNKVKFNGLIIPFHKYTEINGNIKTIQIKRINSKRFVLILVCDIGNDISKENYHNKIMNNFQDYVYCINQDGIIRDEKIIGIDLGIEKLATCSNGLVFKNPKHLKQVEKQLKCLRDKKKRQIAGSTRYQKTCDQIRKLEEKVKNCRKDYLHKVSKELVLKFDTIVIEDLNITSMMENDHIYSLIKKYMSDASWGMLGFMLQYKCDKYGKRLIKVGPEYTSQECSECGNIQKKELSERKHSCEKCGCKMDRDLNAAINIRNRGFGTDPHLIRESG
jgi:putative transposase